MVLGAPGTCYDFCVLILAYFLDPLQQAPDLVDGPKADSSGEEDEKDGGFQKRQRLVSNIFG